MIEKLLFQSNEQLYQLKIPNFVLNRNSCTTKRNRKSNYDENPKNFSNFGRPQEENKRKKERKKRQKPRCSLTKGVRC